MMNSVRIPQMEVVMLENYFAKPSTIDRIRAHWLAPQIERYVEWMQTNGYADRNIISRVPYLCHFADFTERRGTADLNSAAAQVEEFASHWVAPTKHAQDQSRSVLGIYTRSGIRFDRCCAWHWKVASR